ncbi:hypothetical protein B484DRAFT_440720 [Ochromonadaceae sp. CCMP2298]|nr:hypothetical protein B484DRAFT_440720 [Ochromonadaceae sp. CCMP2298]
MADDYGLQTCFVDFVKSGLWLDSLGVEGGSEKHLHEERVAAETGNPIYAYKTSKDHHKDLDGMFQEEDPNLEMSSFESLRSSLHSVSSSFMLLRHSETMRSSSFTEGYQIIEDHPFFSTQTLKHVMFSKFCSRCS